MMYEEQNIEPEFSKRVKKNPFKTPDHYFDSIEDRVMNNIGIKKEIPTPAGSVRVLRFLKPVLAIAACLAIAFLLVYRPGGKLSHQEIVKSGITETAPGDSMEVYSLSFSLVDENSLINTIVTDDKSIVEEINPDEVLAYLSSDMNDVEILSEIQN